MRRTAPLELPWSPWATAVAVALPLLAIVLPAFWLSENIHAFIESAAFDRLHLGLRTFYGEGLWGPQTPWRYTPDPNYPLGSGVVFGLPWILGWDPVLFGRLHSLIWALLAAAALSRLVGRTLGRALGALAFAAVFAVPAFVRGTVVTGEEAPYTALVLLALGGLIAAREARAGGGEPWKPASAAALALIGAVLFRLDAMTLFPLFGVLALFALGWWRGLLWSAVVAAGPLLHFWVSKAVYGDPLRFMEASGDITRQTGEAIDFTPWVLPELVVDQIGGPWIGLLALIGLVLLLRSGFGGRALAALALWLLLVDESLVVRASMQPRAVRYLVPALVLWVPLAVAGAAWLARRWGGRASLAAALLVTAGSLAHGGVRARNDALRFRLPPGSYEVADWLREEAAGQRVMLSARGPELTTISRVPHPLMSTLRGGQGHWHVDGPELERELSDHRADLLVAVDWSEAPRVLCAAELPDRTLVWRQGALAVYRVRPERSDDPPALRGGEPLDCSSGGRTWDLPQ